MYRANRQPDFYDRFLLIAWFLMIEFLSDNLQTISHYGQHLVFTAVLSFVFFRKNWKKAYLIMLATMLVDIDHLLSWPDVFVPGRCSIGYHPLHTYWAIGVYALMMIVPKLRAASVGLLFHMFTDFTDCLWTKYLGWFTSRSCRKCVLFWVTAIKPYSLFFNLSSQKCARHNLTLLPYFDWFHFAEWKSGPS